MKTLTEFIVKKHQKVHKHNPKTKKELIENIKVELASGNCDLNCINTSNITNMDSLFDLGEDEYDSVHLTSSQQKHLNVSQWDTSNVRIMSGMFNDCKEFNCDISEWDVSSVAYFNFMFFGCSSFNQDLSQWDVSTGEDFDYMFAGCDALKKKPTWYKD